MGRFVAENLTSEFIEYKTMGQLLNGNCIRCCYKSQGQRFHLEFVYFNNNFPRVKMHT